MHRIYLDKKMVSLDTQNTVPPEYITIAGNLRSVVFKYSGYLPQADSFYYRVYDLEEREKLKLHKIELQLFIR